MNILRFLLVAAASMAAICASARPQDFHVIPMPEHVTLSDGVFNVKGAPVRTDEAMDEASIEAVCRFARSMETATGTKSCKGKGGFIFRVNPSLGAEEYTIHIDRKEAVVEASALNGFIYACETLRQMLPAPVYGNKKAKADWVLPCADISDAPRFAGSHLAHSGRTGLELLPLPHRPVRARQKTRTVKHLPHLLYGQNFVKANSIVTNA